MGPERSHLAKGREAVARRSWAEAFEALSAARDGGSAEPADLESLALAAYLTGHEEAFRATLEATHRAWHDLGRAAAAARSAFWLGFHLATRGDMARASGWFGRAARVLEDVDGECAEQGYLRIPEAHRHLMAGELEACVAAASEAVAVGRRTGDRDLVALALHVEGRGRLRQGRVAEGLALLDEAMVSVATDDLSPLVTGIVYCSVIGACREVQALGRAHEWTEALEAWCERQPDMVAYRGECRVYRAEILRLRGAWADALAEARRAVDRLGATSLPGTEGSALYQEAEVHRLRGELAEAEEAYRAASRAGHEPLPGLALLRLEQGKEEAAAAAIRRGLAERREGHRRARLLPAATEIFLAAGEPDEARSACRELEELAGAWGQGALQVEADAARGRVELEGGDAAGALPHLRRAWRGWAALHAPHEAARTRLLLARACRELGDRDGAELELNAAEEAFRRLEAAPDLARARALRDDVGEGGGGGAPGGGRPAPADDHGLTPRQLEVLALVATGRTNRAIGRELSISEKTVARHVADIFARLGLSSRSAATAYAYEHGLVDPST